LFISFKRSEIAKAIRKS